MAEFISGFHDRVSLSTALAWGGTYLETEQGDIRDGFAGARGRIDWDLVDGMLSFGPVAEFGYDYVVDTLLERVSTETTLIERVGDEYFTTHQSGSTFIERGRTGTHRYSVMGGFALGVELLQDHDDDYRFIPQAVLLFGSHQTGSSTFDQDSPGSIKGGAEFQFIKAANPETGLGFGFRVGGYALNAQNAVTLKKEIGTEINLGLIMYFE